MTSIKKKLLSVLVAFLLGPGIVVHAYSDTPETVISEGCLGTVPENFTLSDSLNEKMGVLEAWCKYPAITKATVNGARKPKAYFNITGLHQDDAHNLYAAKYLNGSGVNQTTLGFAPRTAESFGTFCVDTSELQSTAQTGDVMVSLLGWNGSCLAASSSLKTIPVFGVGNDGQDFGDTRNPNIIVASHGADHGRGIDYYTPGDYRISYAIPQIGGIVVAVNTALLASGRAALNTIQMKKALDASSDEAYMRVNGGAAYIKESNVAALLATPATPENRYYGQIVNLSKAIEYALAQVPPVTPPTPNPPKPAGTGLAMPAIFSIMLLDE